MESTLKILNSDNLENKEEVLKELIQKFSDQFTFPELDENNYRTLTWNALHNILRDNNQEKIHLLSLTVIRFLSREKKHLNEVVTTDFLNLIFDIGGLRFNSDSLPYDEKLLEALRSSCNILFNANVCREVALRSGILEGIFKRMDHYESLNVVIDVKILDIKILFILSALQSDTRKKITKELNGLTKLVDVLQTAITAYHSINVDELLKKKYVELLGEILKTLFNITIQFDIERELSITLIKALGSCILWESQYNENTDLPNHIVNLLINVPESDLKHLMLPIEDNPTTNELFIYKNFNMITIHRLLEYFNSKFDTNSTVSKQLELLSPILTVLRNCVRSNRAMRKYLRKLVLPPLEDIHSRPEEGTSYRNHCCKLLTSPITEVRDLVADFLFILCKEDVNRMIKYTGYGNAAGMFATRGLMLGGKTEDSAEYSSDSENSDTEEYTKYKSQINPVLGCYQADRPRATDNMTEEQKEFEAMKLVQLMDDLTRTGIVRPCTVGADGKPKPVEHVLELQEGLRAQQVRQNEDSD